MVEHIPVHLIFPQSQVVETTDKGLLCHTLREAYETRDEIQNKEKEVPVLKTKLLGWKISFEKLNTQMTCEFIVISQLLGGQF